MEAARMEAAGMEDMDEQLSSEKGGLEEDTAYYVEADSEYHDLYYGVGDSDAEGDTDGTTVTEEGGIEVVVIEDDKNIISRKKTYYTVTMIPSEGDPVELCDVLVVKQPNDKDKKEDDLKVVDFDETEGDNPVTVVVVDDCELSSEVAHHGDTVV